MKILICMVLAGCTALAGCHRAPADTVDSLTANPSRLHEVLQHCQSEPVPDADNDALCKLAYQAQHKRFFGNGDVPYTPSSSVKPSF
ncbi:EexN family lipoprotein [Pandoraea sputorum]|uniref:EexN family lipoprotein n=1 Tax=Pandoraea sputorum TaxID=93222 RepID=UPI001241EEE3|nr:EexN family lipoprotein [Pandoraea sputorum]VVE82976.1 entry exclusion lipoprotein TrbK [Pandoraea sputorum]